MGKRKGRYHQTNNALIEWMTANGRLGRKWATQRLPQELIFAIRELASSRGVSPAVAIESAFRGNPDYSSDFDRISSRKHVELEGQQTLFAS